jgi:protein Mpv17
MASVALARAYQHSFDSHPYATLAFTNGTLTAIGDAVAQSAEKIIGSRTHKEHDPPFRYDTARTLRFFTFGFAMGPLIGRWNLVLEKYFPLRIASSQGQGQAGKVSGRALAKRVAVDQLFMAPIGLTMFIGSMGYMEGRNGEHIKQKYKDMYVPALMANWQVWPLAQLVNFRYMPLPYRVPFQSSCGVLWTLYLSMLNSGEDKKQDTSDSLRHTVNDRAKVMPAGEDSHIQRERDYRIKQGRVESLRQ